MVGRLLLCLALLSTAQAAPTADERAQAFLTQERDLLAGLDGLDRRLAETTLAEAAVSRQLSELLASQPELEGRLADAKTKLAAERARVRLRLRVRARTAETALPRILLSAESVGEFLRRRHYLDRIVRADLVALARVKADTELVAALMEMRERALSEQREAEQALTAKRQSLEQERALKAALLRRVRGERALFERVTSAHTRQQDLLEASLGPMLEAAAEVMEGFSGSLEPQRGRLPWPVRGRVLRGFGRQLDPVLKTATFSKGIDIKAEVGTPVRAIAKGRVVYSGWYQGFGNLVIVDHGGSYHTLHAHLLAISKAKGEWVEPGAVLGEVGETGTLGEPMLHFELRKGSQPLDPKPWLGKRP